MKAKDEDDRLRHLALAFHGIARSTPGLKVDPPAVRTMPGAGREMRPVFRVRLRSSRGEGRARMLVHDRGAKLEMRVGAEKPMTSEDLPIDLRAGYRWQAGVCEDAGQMAEVLYQHMTERLAAAADRGT